MSVFVLTSAGGAPGVTTTTLGLACTWPRSVIAVEADAVGGSSMLAGFFGGFRPPTQSVVDLLMAHRAGRLPDELPQSLIAVESTQAQVLPGPRSHAQAHSALELWEPLGLTWQTLHGAETDVIVDAGRLGMQWYPEPLLRLADLVLLVTRSDLPGLAAAKQWADQAAENRHAHPEAPPWGSLVIGPGNPYSVREISAVLGLPVVDSLGLDPRGAQVYSRGARLVRRGRLVKDLTRCGHSLRQWLASADQVLAPQGATTAAARGTGRSRAPVDQVLAPQEAR